MARWRLLFLTPLLAGLMIACQQISRSAAKPAGKVSSRPGIEGFWQGTLHAGAVPLRLVFKIRKTPEGSLTGTLDSIDQGAKDIPLSDIRLKDGTVRVQVNAVFGVYEAKLARDGAQMTGQWKQGGASLPLTLKRVEKVAELRRPQEPKPPYPYEAEEVAYDNKAGGSHLAGTLTLPRGTGPFPAALLITGSGPQDRNEALMGHKPFLVLADSLTRRGIAVLRVDDRGVGGSTGEFAKATSQDFAGDVLAGVEYLKSRKEIDPRKIGLIGHSEGGMIAPMCAVRSKDIAFIVLMAGPGIPGEQILYRQSALILKASGTSPKLMEQNEGAQRRLFAVLKREPDSAAAEKELRKIYAALPLPASPDPAKASAGAKAKPGQGKNVPRGIQEAMVQMMLSPWFRYFLTYDPRPTLRQVHCPVLAVNGEKDLQVSAQDNLPAIQDALKAGGNPDFTVKELPRLNHLFQTARTGSPAEYGQIEETIAPAALGVIGDWIVQRTVGLQQPGKRGHPSFVIRVPSWAGRHE